jgi:ferrous iron transport protein B
MYQLSIVEGYKITNYTWPLLAAVRNFMASILPFEEFLFDPILRSMPLGVIDGIIAVLNYVPIFVILFALVAIMEDTGYMARMAFILDRIFRYFGLHGQSVLPLVLGGVYIGGCAIPGVMACRGIKDEKARLATILVVPLMNCLAKIPFYVFLIGMFFAAYKGLVMFFIATITIIIALSVSKILSLTILKRKESAPFILEMPSYHMPTLGGVSRRCLERLWSFVSKIILIVIPVMIIIYLLTNFPGLNQEKRIYYENQVNQETQTFYKKIGEDSYYAKVLSGPKLMEFIRYNDDYKEAKRGAKGEEGEAIVDQKFQEKNFDFFKIVKKGRYEIDGEKIKDKDAKKVQKAYKNLERTRKELQADKKEETITGSYLGRVGRSLESVTKFAGFNWKINIGLISSFAYKANVVGVLGSIYESGEGETLEKRVAEKEKGWTPLHAAAMMLFMAMYPPCIPTLLMIQVEVGIKWMLLALIYPIILGAGIAVLVFTGGNLLGLSGLQAMIAFYILAIVFMVIMGLVKKNPK